MTTNPIRILFVDNKVDAREWLAEQLQASYGFRVDTVSDGEEAISRVRANAGQYQVMVIDLRLGSGRDGIETMKAIQAEYPDIETIIITGFGSREDGIRAIEQGACNFILKPVNHEQLAVYISSADERRRLRMTAKERDWLQQLLDLSQSMSSSVTPEDVAERIYDRVQRFFPQVDAFYIAIHEPNQKRMRSLLAIDNGNKSSFACEDSLGLAGLVIKSWEPLFIDDDQLRAFQQSGTCFDAKRPVRSYTGIPLISGNELVGVLSAQSYEPSAFNKAHKQLLQEIANRAAVVIENAMLHQQTSRRLTVLSNLYQTLAALRMQFSLDSVLDLIAHNLQELFTLDTCTIGLLDINQTRFEFRAARGFEQKVIRSLNDLPQQMIDHVFATSEPIVIQNVDDVPGLKNALVVPDLRSFLILPLHGRLKNLLGIISMGSRSSIELPAEDQSLLRALADQAAIAIEDDRLREESQQWVQQLESLDQVALDIANETEIRTLLRKIIQKATELTHGIGGGIYLIQTDREHIVLEAAFGLASEMEGMQMEPGVSVVGKVVESGAPYTQADYGKWHGRSSVLDKFNFTAVAGAPIFASNGVLLGCIAVHTDEKGRQFSKLELQSLFRFGFYAGAELEKAGLLDQLSQKSDTLQLLLDFSNTLAGARDVDDALRIFVEKMMEACPTSFCHVLLHTRGSERLRVRIAHSAQRNQAMKWHSSEGEACALFTKRWIAKKVQDRKSIVLERGESTSSVLSRIDLHLKLDGPLQSALLIPLRIGREIVGMCFLGEMRQFRIEPNRLSLNPENITLAEALASQAATRLDHFRTLEVEENRSNVLKRLSEVGSAIAATLDRDQVLEMIVDHSRTLLNAEACTIFLVNREGALRLEAASGYSEGSYQKGVEIQIGLQAGLTGFIAHCGETFRMSGQKLRHHPAIKKRGPQQHLPSGFCESLLVIPLKRRSGEQEELIGLIKVENKKDRTGKLDLGSGFDGDDAFILKTLADCAVTAIQNAELFGLTRTLEKVSRVTLEKVAKVAFSTLDLDDVLHQVLAELRHLIPFDTSSIQLVTGENLKLVACNGLDEQDIEKVLNQSFPLHDPKFPNFKVIATKEPFLIPDMRAPQHSHFWDLAGVRLAGNIRSWLGIPLLHGDEVVGMISIDSKTPERYTELDKDLGKAFAGHVVSAIVNARLHKSTQSLIDITVDITRQPHLEAVLKRIAEDATNKDAFIGADLAIIYLYDPDQNNFIETPVYDGTLYHPNRVNPPFSQESVVWRLIREKNFRFHYEKGVADGPIISGRFADREKPESAFGLSLLVGDKPVGVMFVNYRTPHAFSNVEVGLLDLFGQLAAMAIQNARRYESVSLNLKLARDVARAGILASIFSHDIKGPTASISAYAKALRSSMQASPNDGALIRIEKLAEDIAESFPSSSSTPEAETVDLNRVLEEVSKRRCDDLSRNQISMQVSPRTMPSVRGNHMLMAFVLDNLASNAVRFMPEGGTLTFSGRKDNGQLLLDVVDTGPGVSERIRSQLFKGPVDDPSSPGRRCGLWYSKYILEDFGGDINHSNDDKRGNVFTLSLPLAADHEGENEDSRAHSPHRG